MIESLKHKPNLYDIDDMEVEEFRDLISDLTSYKQFLKLGYIGYFGNECAIETVSHNPISLDDIDDEFLKYISSHYENEISVNDIHLTHSKFYLHTQALEFQKIDLINCNQEKLDDYVKIIPLCMYYEGDDDYYYREKDLDWEINKKRVYSPDDTPPNYDPRQNGYWEEWLKDLFANMKDGAPTLKELQRKNQINYFIMEIIPKVYNWKLLNTFI